MSKILVSSDLHLSPSIWKHKKIFQDSYYSFSQIVDLACDGFDALILAGDLLDKQMNLAEPVQQLVKGIEKCEDAGVPVLFIQGQHEKQKTPWASLSRHATWLDSRETPEIFGEWRLAGLDYNHPDDIQDALQHKRVQTCDILVMHQSWADLAGSQFACDLSLADLPERPKLVLSGDLHQTLLVENQGKNLLSMGSTHLRSVTESQNKFCFSVELPGELDFSKIKIERIPLKTRRMLSLDFRGSDFDTAYEKYSKALKEAQAYSKQLPDELKKPIARIWYNVEDRQAIQAFTLECEKDCHCILQMSSSGNPQVLEDLSEEDGGVFDVSIVGNLDKFISEKAVDELDLSKRLLTASDDPLIILNNWLSEKLT
jgi:DNA repair exonuclease SbcCD nuclease subunit